ncbi:hypothetical protein [Bacteroides fluxus]
MDKIEKYREINNSYKNKLVFHFGTGAGFYSELNNMVLCMLFCLKYKIRFILYSKDAYFSNQNGITEFFPSFCNETTSAFHHKWNMRDIPFSYNHDFISKLKIKYALTRIYIYKMFVGNYLTHDFFYEYRTFWFAAASFDIPELDILGDTQKAAGQLINMIYKFNPTYNEGICDLISTLKIPSIYAGLHIRGGDKIQERNLYSVDAYMEKLQKMSSIKDVFIMTDDYRLYEELQFKYPKYRFYTLTAPWERGYDNSSFKGIDREKQKQSLIKMFASIELLRKSEIIVGTYSANPGMFLGMVVPEKMHGIDFENWQIL